MAIPKQKPGKSRQDYETPQDLLTAIKRRLAIDSFAMDFAADAFNKKGRRWWSVLDDSLAQSTERWVQRCGGEWGWLNPPFAKIGPWAAKCLAAHLYGAKIAFLVPASVGSNWYRDYIHDQQGVKVIFLNGRPSFDGIAGFPKDCMLVLFSGSNAVPFTTEVWTWK